ncbi:SPOSA6832_03695, partial [Sporobolomyces salmonicolor]
MSSKPFPSQPTFPLSPVELQRWVRFSAKGGVGKAVARVDKVSEDASRDLMMLEGDEVVVLMDLGGELYLVRIISFAPSARDEEKLRHGPAPIQGFCEGVVGLFHGAEVVFQQFKLKRPVMTPRSSSSAFSRRAAAPSPASSPPLPPPPRSATSFDLCSNANVTQRVSSREIVRSASVGHLSSVPSPQQEQQRTRRKPVPALEVVTEALDGQQWDAAAASAGRRDLRSRRRGEVEGLGIEVLGADASERQKSEKAARRGGSVYGNYELAGAFASLTQSPSVASFRQIARSPSPSSSLSTANRTPSLVTSPYSDFADDSVSSASHGTPATPSVPIPSTSSAVWDASIVSSSPQMPSGLFLGPYDTFASAEPDNVTPTADKFPIPAYRDATIVAPPRTASAFTLSPFSTSRISTKRALAIATTATAQVAILDRLVLDLRKRLDLLHPLQRSSAFPFTLFSSVSPTSSLVSTSSLPSSFLCQTLRTPKSSSSTIASTSTASSGGFSGSSTPPAGSAPGTPGEDPTLAFIFDSYRYSIVPRSSSVDSFGGKVTPVQNSLTESPARATKELRGEVLESLQNDPNEEEKLQGDEETGDELTAGEGVGRSFGAASELRERMRLVGSVPALSALPPHLSPEKSRKHASHLSTTSTIEGVHIPRLSHIFPRSDTNDSISSLPSLRLSDGGDSMSPRAYAPTRSLRQDDTPRASVPVATPVVPAPTSLWRSPDTSPVHQAVLRERSVDDETDVFVASPSSMDSAPQLGVVGPSPYSSRTYQPSSTPIEGSNDNCSPSRSRQLPVSPSSATYEPDQYALRLPPPMPSHTTMSSPSSASFFSYASVDESSSPAALSFSDQSETGSTRAGVAGPHKLRKKSSIRLKHSQSTPQLATSESQASLKLYSFPPPPLEAPDRQASDPFDATSLPKSPGKTLSHKSSVGLFMRKVSSPSIGSSENDRDKKVDYGVGISNKDFEEETVKIGNSAFEIVKPYAALLAKDDGDDQDIASPPSHSVDEDRSRVSLEYDELTTPRRPPVPPLQHAASTQPGLSHSFSTVSLVQHSHFSPPTPASLDGTERSLEDHRAKELKWVQTLGSMTAAQARKSKKIRQLVLSGVPSSVRGKVWAFLAEAEREKRPGLYASLCSTERLPLSIAVMDDLSMILLDHPQFALGSAGREDLEAVLHAFARFDQQLGYFPGLVNVVALLLMQMPAEEAFFTLVSLVRNYGFKQFFPIGKEELRLETLAFGFLLEAVGPKTAKRLRDLAILPSSYLPIWLSTLFLSILPLPSVLRIVDLLLFDPKTRYRAPLALLDLSHLTDESAFPTRDSVLNHLLAPPPAAFSPALLVPVMRSIKLSDDRVKKSIKKAAQVMLTPKA